MAAGAVVRSHPRRARPRRGPWRERIGQDVDLVKARLGVEDVLGGAPGAGLQPDLAQLLDVEAAPLAARRQPVRLPPAYW